MQVCPVVFLPFQLKGNDSWSSPDVWWRRPALAIIMPEPLRPKLARAFNMVICLVMAPDKHLTLEVPQPLPDVWDPRAASGQDKDTYKSREDAVKEASQLTIPLELPPRIDREPYNWRLPQRGVPNQPIAVPSPYVPVSGTCALLGVPCISLQQQGRACMTA